MLQIIHIRQITAWAALWVAPGLTAAACLPPELDFVEPSSPEAAGGLGGAAGAGGSSSGDTSGGEGGAGGASIDCDVCDGLCTGSVCNAFEVLAEGQYQTSYTRGIAPTEDSIFWASATDYMLATSFQVQMAPKSAAGSGNALLEGLTRTSWVVGGSASWIYFGGSGYLERLSLDGTTREVVYDRVVADARIENGHIWRVEHWSNATKVVLRAEMATTDTTMLEFFGDNFAGQKIGALETSHDDVLVAVNFPSSTTYDILSISSGGTTQLLVSQMPGSVTRLRLDRGDLLWIEQPASGPDVLKRADVSEIRSTTSAATLHDFAIDGQHLYVSFALDASEAASRGYQRGIRRVDLATGEEVDVAVGFQAGSLEVSDGHLYLFDRSNYRLVRAETL